MWPSVERNQIGWVLRSPGNSITRPERPRFVMVRHAGAKLHFGQLLFVKLDQGGNPVTYGMAKSFAAYSQIRKLLHYLAGQLALRPAPALEINCIMNFPQLQIGKIDAVDLMGLQPCGRPAFDQDNVLG